MVFVYPGIEGPQVERVAGPSNYGSAASERYTQETYLILGDDYRVQWSSESIYFEVVSKPTLRGKPVAATEEEPPHILYSESFPGGATPPVVKVHVAEHAESNVAWKRCHGYWRGALIIDFGKNLPSFVDGNHALPAKDFVTEIGEAFRGPIVEIGELY
ncbi:MAG TPA: hypothetical protein VKE95_02940 [Burkholderiales bacterium]|nr:hypothetical protein [Burkholderiales bacterium]